MSETNKTNQIPSNTINYIVFGKENELEITVNGKNEQAAVQDIPGIPMEIQVSTHTLEVEGTKVIRKDKNGNKLGTVTDKRVIKAVKASKETEEHYH